MSEWRTVPVPAGSAWRRFYVKGSPLNGLCHVRAIVDEEWVVWRWWFNLRWNYKVEHIDSFRYDVKLGVLTRVK